MLTSLVLENALVHIRLWGFKAWLFLTQLPAGGKNQQHHCLKALQTDFECLNNHSFPLTLLLMALFNLFLLRCCSIDFVLPQNTDNFQTQVLLVIFCLLDDISLYAVGNTCRYLTNLQWQISKLSLKLQTKFFKLCPGSGGDFLCVTQLSLSGKASQGNLQSSLDKIL